MCAAVSTAGVVKHWKWWGGMDGREAGVGEGIETRRVVGQEGTRLNVARGERARDVRGDNKVRGKGTD